MFTMRNVDVTLSPDTRRFFLVIDLLDQWLPNFFHQCPLQTAGGISSPPLSRSLPAWVHAVSFIFRNSVKISLHESCVIIWKWNECYSIFSCRTLGFASPRDEARFCRALMNRIAHRGGGRYHPHWEPLCQTTERYSLPPFLVFHARLERRTARDVLGGGARTGQECHLYFDERLFALPISFLHFLFTP